MLDWEEFKDLQLAFIKASVVDIELVTDHAILGVLFRQASQEGVKYIVSGSNVATEWTVWQAPEIRTALLEQLAAQGPFDRLTGRVNDFVWGQLDQIHLSAQRAECIG